MPKKLSIILKQPLEFHFITSTIQFKVTPMQISKWPLNLSAKPTYIDPHTTTISIPIVNIQLQSYCSNSNNISQPKIDIT